MTRRRQFKFFGLAMLGGAIISVIFCGRVFVYDTNVAHPGLTQSAADLYGQLTADQTKWLMQGAIDEDYPLRWMNHFYNPVTQTGFKGSFDSAKIWAKNANNQAGFSLGDQSWPRAIYNYQQGKEKEAFVALGHILHLLEDMTVPAHTRDDAHPEGDPYEQWVKENYVSMSGSPIYFDTLEQYFDYLANFSHSNFYSKDTINSVPDLFSENGFIYKKYTGVTYKILGYNQNVITGRKEYFINPEVSSDYYRLLAPKAVGAGAGVIKLFFDEVKKAEVAKPTVLQTNIWGELQEPIGTVVQLAEGILNSAKSLLKEPGNLLNYIKLVSESLSGSIALAQELNNKTIMNASLSKVVEKITEAVTTAVPIKPEIKIVYVEPVKPALLLLTKVTEQVPVVSVQSSPTSVPSVESFLSEPTKTIIKAQEILAVPLVPSVSVSQPTYRGSATMSQAPASVSVESSPPSVLSSPDITPPEAPTILEPTGNKVWIKTATTTLSGLVSLDTYKLYINDKEQELIGSAWSIIISTREGENIFNIIVEDLAGNKSTLVVVKIYQDTIAPTASIIAVNKSSEHLVIKLNWAGDDQSGSGIENFVVEYTTSPTPEVGAPAVADAIWTPYLSATTSTQADFVAEEGNQYSFRVRAVDKLGWVGKWAQSLVVSIERPRVVINEIAWGGTQAQANDEWLELYNASDFTVSLNGWTLSDGGDLNIIFPATSTISARGLYLLERTADQTINNIVADLIYKGSLNNNGERLQLKDNIGRLVDEVDCRSRWFAGRGDYERSTMERIDPLVSGSSSANWQFVQPLARNGLDASGNQIYGTPKRPNSSLTYLAGTVNQNRTITAEFSPYILGNLTVASGTVLSFDPGVAVLGGVGSKLGVYGELKTNGTASSSVVFSSLNDTDYRGTMTAPDKYWGRIQLYSGSKAGILNTKIFYANAVNSSYPEGGAIISDGTVLEAQGLEVSKNNITANDYKTLKLVNSSSTISDSIFSKGLYGLWAQGGRLSVQNSRFEDLSLDALNVEGASLTLINNTFKHNGWAWPSRAGWQSLSIYSPIFVKNTIPEAKENIFENNLLNALEISGNIGTDAVIDNLGEWPWLVGNLKILSGVAVSVMPGSTLKMKTAAIVTVNGILNLLGAAEKKINITSLRDIADGFDLNLFHDRVVNPQGLEWKQIIFESVSTSTIQHTNISYANSTPRDTNSSGSVFINQTPMEINNLTIKYSRPGNTAMQIKNTNISLSSIFLKNDYKINYDPWNGQGFGVGLLVDGGAPVVSSSTIDTFNYGILYKNNPAITTSSLNFINVDRAEVKW